MNSFLPFSVSKVYKAIAIILLITLSMILGYSLGNSNNKKAPVTQPYPTSTPTITKIKWEVFSQEFLPFYTFSVYYPLDGAHDPFIYNSTDSGWPISKIETLFKTDTTFGDFRIGVSDIDPTSCYKNSCVGAISSIDNEENVTIDGIASRKVTVKIASKGGGIILPGSVNQSVMYIIPYQNKFIVLLSFYPDADFEKFVSTFQVKPNDVPFKEINVGL